MNLIKNSDFSEWTQPTISYDNLYGSVLARSGYEGRVGEDTHSGLRLFCTSDIDTILRLLEYSTVNIDRIKGIKDTLLKHPFSINHGKTEIPEAEISIALTQTLSKRKEAYIKRMKIKYNKTKLVKSIG